MHKACRGLLFFRFAWLCKPILVLRDSVAQSTGPLAVRSCKTCFLALTPYMYITLQLSTSPYPSGGHRAASLTLPAGRKIYIIIMALQCVVLFCSFSASSTCWPNAGPVTIYTTLTHDAMTSTWFFFTHKVDS